MDEKYCYKKSLEDCMLQCNQIFEQKMKYYTNINAASTRKLTSISLDHRNCINECNEHYKFRASHYLLENRPANPNLNAKNRISE